MKKFRMYLLQKEMRDKELAEILQISKANLSSKLCGRTRFSVDELNVIRKHFDFTDEEFIKMFFSD